MKMQKREKRIRKFAYILFITLAMFVVFNGQTSFAQIVRKKPTTTTVQKKQIFIGKGIVRADLKPANFPEVLPAGEIKMTEVSKNLAVAMNENGFAVKIDGSMPLEKFTNLSIQVPIVYEKASLEFFKPSAVSPRVNAAMLTTNESILRINLKPNAAGKWFVISCLVSPAAGAYTIIGPDGNQAEIFADDKSVLHTFVLSQNTDWQSILIKKNLKEGNDFWYVWTCSINTPKLP